MAQRERSSGQPSVFRGWLPLLCLNRDSCELATLSAVLACLVLCWPARAQISSSEMGWTERYELVMSRDDRVCRPLLAVYNRLRATLFAKRKPFGLGDKGVPVPRTDFERTHPEALRAAHLFVPPSRYDSETSIPALYPGEPPSYPGDPIYTGDFLHRGSPVEVRVHDTVNVRDWPYTEMTLVPGGEKVGIETLVADQAAVHPGASWLTPSRYTLTGWPGFDKLERLAASGAQRVDTFENGDKFHFPIEFPQFGPLVMQRPFLIDGKDAVFLINDSAPVPPLGAEGLVVLARLMPSGHQNLCYLILAPSGLTRIMWLEGRGILETKIPASK